MTRLHLLSLCLVGLITPALADQPSLPPQDAASSASEDASDMTGPPVTSKDALADFVKTCADVGSGDPAASDRATSDGWTAEEPDGSGPYRAVYAGSKDFSGLGTVELWGSVEVYPTQALGYCRVDFSDSTNLLDFADLTGMNNLTGITQTLDNNVYGVWETADKKLLVIADRTDGTVEIEFNLLLGNKPPPHQ